MLVSVKNIISRVWASRMMLVMMVERDFKARYIGSIGGVLWSIINPIIMVSIYSLVFSLIFGRTIGNTPFSLWLFCALLPWMMFNEIVKGSVGLIQKHKNLITKTPFQSEILSFVLIGTSFTGHIIGFGVLMLILFIFKQPIGICVLTIPFYLVCLSIFSLGLSWLVSALNVYLKDIGQIINSVLQLWFYLCPIIYPASIIPEKYHFFLRLNPMYFITEGYRRALIYNVWIPWLDFIFFMVLTILFLILGGWTFRRLKWQFAEVI